MDKVNLDISGLNTKQISLFKETKEGELQSYINNIKEVKTTADEIFAESPLEEQDLDIGQYQDYANILKDVDNKQAALLNDPPKMVYRSTNYRPNQVSMKIYGQMFL